MGNTKRVDYGTFEIQYDQEGEPYFRTDEGEVNYIDEFLRVKDYKAVRSVANSATDIIEVNSDGSEVTYYMVYST